MDILPLQVLKDEKAPAIALLAVLIKLYGVEAMQSQPAIIRNEIERDYSIHFTDLQSDKLQAAIVALTTNLIEEQWEAFKTCMHLFCGIPDSFEDFSILEPEYIAGGLAELYAIKDEETDDFSDEVKRFAGQSFYEYGMCTAPDVFPDALMPVSASKCDCTEKSEALTDIFHERTETITQYMKNLKL